MEFHLATGFGVSETSLKNNEDPSQIGQVVLQGSSSAAPVYNVNSYVSLSAYKKKIASESQFIHPIKWSY
jgi:hypothetical protein